jgi:uncharacterized protein (TIGR02996 family)
MSDDTAFLHAVIEHPDDDGPRLVYADWLDEQGDPRGEFIRVQCELARLGSTEVRPYTAEMDVGLVRIVGLRRREGELWEAGGDRDDRGWFVGLEGFVLNLVPSPDERTAVVRRGFIDSLTLPAEALLGGSCGRCRGSAFPNDDPTDIHAPACSDCHGTGRTAGCADALLWRPGQGRPCPATAQPIRRVVLTTWPDMMTMYTLAHKHRLLFGGSPGNRVERWEEILAAEFPGTTLELPPAEVEALEVTSFNDMGRPRFEPPIGPPRTMIPGGEP